MIHSIDVVRLVHYDHHKKGFYLIGSQHVKMKGTT